MYLALDGYKVSMEVGDAHHAFHGANVYLWSFYYSGLPLSPLISDVEKFSLQMLLYKQSFQFYSTSGLFQLLLNLSGRSEDPTNIEAGEAIDLAGNVPTKKEHKFHWEYLRAYGMELALFMGDVEKATKYYDEIKDLDVGLRKGSILYHCRLFFFALVCIENYRASPKAHFKNSAKRHIELLRDLLKNGAVNLHHKVQILDAASASIFSKDKAPEEVIRKYEIATARATRMGFLQDSALGNYLCGKYCLSQPDKVDSADRFIRQAHDQYLTWGASAVAQSIERRHSNLFPESVLNSIIAKNIRNSGGSLRSRTHFRESLLHMHKSLSTAKLLRDDSTTNVNSTLTF